MDTETINSVMNLAAGLFVLAAAVLNFVSNRLQAARSPNDKLRLLTNTLAGSATACLLGAMASLIVFQSLAVGLWLLVVALLLNGVNFLVGHGGNFRVEVLVLISGMGLVVMLVCFYFLGEIVSVLRELVDLHTK